MGAIINGKKMAIKVIKVTGSGDGSTTNGRYITVSSEQDLSDMLEMDNDGVIALFNGTTGTYENGRLYLLSTDGEVVPKLDTPTIWLETNGGVVLKLDTPTIWLKTDGESATAVLGEAVLGEAVLGEDETNNET